MQWSPDLRSVGSISSCMHRTLVFAGIGALLVSKDGEHTEIIESVVNDGLPNRNGSCGETPPLRVGRFPYGKQSGARSPHSK